MTATTLAAMTVGDVDEVLSLEVEVHARSWTRATFMDEVGRDDRVYLVARDRGEIAGYGGVALLAGEAHITTVAVHPSRRRHGIGDRLVRALLAAARDRGASAATLEVRASNTAARELYRRIGFAPVGVRPGYYEDTGEDALIMWLHDLDSDER